MKNTIKIKQVILIILLVIIIGVIVLIIRPKKEPIVLVPDNNTVEQKPISLCYYRGTKTTQGFYDVAWLKLNIEGDKVTGEFHNLPAESDSKIGTFEGTVDPLIPEIMSRSATVWWDSLAEGMNVKEELAIQFGDKSATVGFGKMIDRGDGVYVYADKKELYYLKSIDQIDCEVLDEKLFAEKYVKDNIKTVATNKPVLGGSWYVISVVANPIAHTGEVIYEDGHIQSKANFIYTYNKNPQSVTVTNWEIVK